MLRLFLDDFNEFWHYFWLVEFDIFLEAFYFFKGDEIFVSGENKVFGVFVLDHVDALGEAGVDFLEDSAGVDYFLIKIVVTLKTTFRDLKDFGQIILALFKSLSLFLDRQLLSRFPFMTGKHKRLVHFFIVILHFYSFLLEKIGE